MTDKSDRLQAQGGFRRTFPFLILIVIGLALWSWPGGLWDIWSRAEAEFVQSARDGLSFGGWLLPGWICAILIKLNEGGITCWALRLPSVIAAIVVLVITFRIGSKLFGSDAGWFGALTFAIIAAFFGAVPAIHPGMMLTAWIILAVDIWIERPRHRITPLRAVAVALLAMAAMLTVGWPAPIMIAAILGGTLVVRRRMSAPVAWIVVGLIALMDRGQRAVVLATLLPPIALLAGPLLNRLSAKSVSPRLCRKLAILMLLVSIGLCIEGIVLYVNPDDVWSYGFFVLRLGLSLLLLLVIVLAALAGALWKRPNTPALMAVLFVVLFMLNVVFLGGVRPAMNPIRSGENISHILGLEVSRKDRLVGVVGRSDDPRYHVYGRYRVKTLAEQPAELAKPDAPNVLLVANEDMSRLMSALQAAGYTRTKRLESIGQRFVVMRRDQPKPDTNQVIRLFALGDTGTGNKHQYAIGRRMAEVADEFGPMTACLLLGDNIYEDDELEVGLRNRFLKPFDPLIGRHIPFYACIGNHDYSSLKKAKFEFKTPWFNMNGHNYYSKTFGDDLITFFFMDCETLRKDPVQFLWLKNELMNCVSQWKVLVNHVPMLASNVLHADNPAMFDLIDQVMVDGKIDLVLSGHNHFYERRTLHEDMQFLTVGCGGHVDDNFDFPEDPERVVGYNKKCCFSWMEVTGDSIHFRVQNEDAKPIDEFVLRHNKAQKIVVEEFPRANWDENRTTATAGTLTSR